MKKPAYFYEEIIFDPSGPITYKEYLPIGDVMAYDYGRFLANGILNKNTFNIFHVSDSFPASVDSIVFLTNHDLERQTAFPILSYNNSTQTLYRLGQIFMLAWPFGYPFIYSGYSFSDFDQGPPLAADLSTLPILDANDNCRAPWTCEHRLAEIPPMVSFRNLTNGSFFISNWWSNGSDALAFSRGTDGFIAINFSNFGFQQEFTTPMEDGLYCNILESTYNLKNKTCETGYRVQNGRIRLAMPAMSAFAILKQTTVNNSRK
jgi:alpha-amylase